MVGIKEKRKPKNPIKFQLQLNEEQKLAKALIVENPVVVLKGMAGSGKTLVAVQAALDMLFCKEVEKIIITRPTVAKEELGFLPGDLKEKMDPWLAPIYHNLYMLYGKEKIDREIEYGHIEIVKSLLEKKNGDIGGTNFEKAQASPNRDIPRYLAESKTRFKKLNELFTRYKDVNYYEPKIRFN